MQEAAEPLLQVIEADGTPLHLYADDDVVIRIIQWVLSNRVALRVSKKSKVVVDVGPEDISGSVTLSLLRTTKAA